MTSLPTTRVDPSLLDAHGIASAYLRPDPGGAILYDTYVTADGVSTIMTGDQRFALVSSLYGPGNLACWLLLLLSVVISWTLNPRSASKDTITNDFMAALAMPIVAVAHFFHQIHQQTRGGRGVFDLFSEPEWDNVRMVAAIEASLTVCEDFVCWAAMLHFVAGRKQQKMRTSMVVTVGWMCLSAELFLLSVWIPFEKSLLIRPFLFHSIPMFVILIAWFALAALAYLVEVIYGTVLLYKDSSGRELESGNSRKRQVLKPGRVSSWMAACTGIVAGLATVWVKYGWIYPMGWSNSVRFVAKSTVRISDLDQVVTMVGGVLALYFSILDAVKERRKARV
jgi:hypothetical protein